MHSFKDLSGQEWQIRLNFAMAEEIEDACKVDLSTEEGIQKVLSDRKTFLTTLDVLLRGQYQAAGRTLADLKSAFDGDVWSGAGDALEAEFAFFSRGGATTEKAIQAVQRRRKILAEKFATTIERGGLDHRLELSISENGPVTTAASSESTPAP